MTTHRIAITCVLLAASAFAQSNTTPPPTDSQETVIEFEKPRVFITDSQSWETRGAGGGTAGGFGGASSGEPVRKPPR